MNILIHKRFLLSHLHNDRTVMKVVVPATVQQCQTLANTISIIRTLFLERIYFHILEAVKKPEIK